MKGKKTSIAGIATALIVLFGVVAPAGAERPLNELERLGKLIYFDDTLSYNQNLACAGCHAPQVGFTGALDMINAHGAVYEGSIAGRFGNRKPPSAAYAAFSPVLHVDSKGAFVGGNFWDGRATGEKLGNPAADQAQGPFLNPLEMALPDADAVVDGVCSGVHANLFKQIWGDEICDEGSVEEAFDAIALSIAAYEASAEVSEFSSKYDATFTGEVQLTKQERQGYALFRGKAKCGRCHVANGQRALFTDFTYDNLGVPRNPENPFYTELEFNPLGYDWIDYGLGAYLATRDDYAAYAEANLGKQKVPTLRNVGKGSCEAGDPSCITKAYTHNGYFKSVGSVVHFYNTRDVLPTCPGDYTEAEALSAGCWPPPEVTANLNVSELGDLGLTAEEEAALTAFLMTLSDGYKTTGEPSGGSGSTGNTGNSSGSSGSSGNTGNSSGNTGNTGNTGNSTGSVS